MRSNPCSTKRPCRTALVRWTVIPSVCPLSERLNRFRGKGIFSKLFHFTIDDLQQKGFTKATLGVVPSDTKNKEIYAHDGFSEYAKSGRESYPDGTVLDEEYYRKTLA